MYNAFEAIVEYIGLRRRTMKWAAIILVEHLPACIHRYGQDGSAKTQLLNA
jgi:hypothetical protein